MKGAFIMKRLILSLLTTILLLTAAINSSFTIQARTSDASYILVEDDPEPSYPASDIIFTCTPNTPS